MSALVGPSWSETQNKTPLEGPCSAQHRAQTRPSAAPPCDTTHADKTAAISQQHDELTRRAAIKIQAWWRATRTRELPTASQLQAINAPTDATQTLGTQPQPNLTLVSGARLRVVEQALALRGKLFWLTDRFHLLQYGPLTTRRAEMSYFSVVPESTRQFALAHGGKQLGNLASNAMVIWLTRAFNGKSRYQATRNLFDPNAGASCIDFVYLVLFMAGQLSKRQLYTIYSVSRNAYEDRGDPNVRLFPALAGAVQRPLDEKNQAQPGDFVFLKHRSSGEIAHVFVYGGRDSEGRPVGIGLWNLPRRDGDEYPRVQSFVIPDSWHQQVDIVYASLDDLKANVGAYTKEHAATTRNGVAKRFWRDLTNWWYGTAYFE